MNKFLIIILFLILNSVLCEFDLEEIEDDSGSEITPCLLKLAEKYFKSKIRSQGSLAILNIKPDGSQFQKNVLCAFNENPSHELAVMIKDADKKHFNASHVTEKAKNYFMLISDKSYVADIIIQLRALPTWNPLAQVMVFFTIILDEATLKDQSIAVLEELFESGMINANVMSQRINTSLIQITTWYPYERDGCARAFNRLRLIDECEYLENDRGDMVFKESHYHADWEKIPDEFHDCDFNVAAYVLEPFTHYKPDRGFYKGIDYFMIQTALLQMKLNPVFKLIPHNQINYFGSDVNGSMAFQQILTGEADLIIGGLTENIVSRSLLTASTKYYQDDMTFCVHKAGLAPNLMNVFAIFDLATWIFAVFLLHLTGYLLWKFSTIEHTEQGNFFWGLLQALAVTLAQSSSYYPRKQGIRFYFICLLIYGMHFNAAYQSFLISVLTRPRYKAQVNNIFMAVAQGFHFTGSENILNYYIENIGRYPMAKYVSEHFEICPDLDVCLRKILEDPYLAVAVSREHSLNSPLMRKTDMFCFPRTGNIYNFLVSVLAKKDYHLLPKINKFIRRILESGLLVKWQNDGDQAIGGSGLKNQNTNSGATIVLRLDHIQGAFIVGFIGLILSILAFAFEWLVFTQKKKKSVKYLPAIEKLLCFD